MWRYEEQLKVVRRGREEGAVEHVKDQRSVELRRGEAVEVQLQG
jgi:hypothetical protein